MKGRRLHHPAQGERAGTRREAHRALIKAWRALEIAERGPVTAKRAIAVAFNEDGPVELRAALEELATDKSGKVTAARLGYVLRRLRQRAFRVDGVSLALDSSLDRTRTTVWGCISSAQGSPDPGITCSPDPKNPTDPEPDAGDAGDAGDASSISTREQETTSRFFERDGEGQNITCNHLHHLQDHPGPERFEPDPDPPDDEPPTDDELIGSALAALRDPQLHGLTAGFPVAWPREAKARADQLARPMLADRLPELRGPARQAAIEDVARAVRVVIDRERAA